MRKQERKIDMSIPYLDQTAGRWTEARERRRESFYRECCAGNVPFIVARRWRKHRKHAYVKCDLISVWGAVGLTPEAEAAIRDLWNSMPGPTRRNESHGLGVGYISDYTHVPLDRVPDTLKRLAEIVEGNIVMREAF